MRTGAAIVVGVDASEEGRLAVEYALSRAKDLGRCVDLITVWSAPDALAEAEQLRAQRIQESALAYALSRVENPPFISCWVVRGEPAVVLERASRTGELLVLGNPTGYGGVYEYCRERAQVPVVVVPAEDISPIPRTPAVQDVA